MNTPLNWDEFIHVLLFLPATDTCHYSHTNSTAYDCIISNQELWTMLFKRDFAWVRERGSTGPQSFLLTPTDTTLMVGQHCCEAMRDYVCTYLRFHQFPFYRVDPRSFKAARGVKVLFSACNNRMNQLVADTLKNQQLVIQQNGVPYKEPIVIGLSCVWLASRQPKETLLAFQFWMIGQHSKTNPSTARDYYRAAKCLMITIDTNHAWREDSYSVSPSHDGTNSLSLALAALTENRSKLKLEPPHACKGVLIVGIGAWPEAAPISKQRFLKDCAQSFDVLPLEYFELTENNAMVMSDVLLRRLYSFHQQATLDDSLCS